MLVAAFIILALILVFLCLPVSSAGTAFINQDGFSLKIRVRLARAITLFGWDSDEEGFSFLTKKRVRDEKKKKTRLNIVLGRIFNPRSIINLKGMTVAVFEASGVIATEDAARTALVYGSLCGVISIIIPFINSRKIKVDFYPDFQKKKPDFHISCIIRIRIIHIIYLLIEYYRDRKKKGGTAYGTASY